MTSFRVELKSNQVVAYLRDVPRAVRAAAQSAINSMSPDIREESAVGISSVYNIKKRTAKAGVKMVARASPNRLRAVWEPQGRAIPLTQYGAKVVGSRRGRSTNAPISVEVLRGKRKVVQHAFRGPFGQVTVRKGGPRTPTRRLYGPGVPMAFARDEVTKAMISVSDRILPVRMETELVRQLRKIETGKLPALR